MSDSPLVGPQCNYVSLSCNVLLNGLCIDYITRMLITIKHFIYCETKQLIDRCFDHLMSSHSTLQLLKLSYSKTKSSQQIAKTLTL